MCCAEWCEKDEKKCRKDLHDIKKSHTFAPHLRIMLVIKKEVWVSG